MNLDWVKIISIVTVAVVTILSFLLANPDIQLKLVLGLLALTGIYGIGAGMKFVITKLSRSGNE